MLDHKRDSTADIIRESKSVEILVLDARSTNGGGNTRATMNYKVKRQRGITVMRKLFILPFGYGGKLLVHFICVNKYNTQNTNGRDKLGPGHKHTVRCAKYLYFF